VVSPITVASIGALDGVPLVVREATRRFVPVHELRQHSARAARGIRGRRGFGTLLQSEEQAQGGAIPVVTSLNQTNLD